MSFLRSSVSARLLDYKTTQKTLNSTSNAPGCVCVCVCVYLLGLEPLDGLLELGDPVHGANVRNLYERGVKLDSVISKLIAQLHKLRVKLADSFHPVLVDLRANKENLLSSYCQHNQGEGTYRAKLCELLEEQRLLLLERGGTINWGHIFSKTLSQVIQFLFQL